MKVKLPKDLYEKLSLVVAKCARLSSESKKQYKLLAPLIDPESEEFAELDKKYKYYKFLYNIMTKLHEDKYIVFKNDFELKQFIYNYQEVDIDLSHILNNLKKVEQTNLYKYSLINKARISGVRSTEARISEARISEARTEKDSTSTLFKNVKKMSF
jgi:hypothetical protein